MQQLLRRSGALPLAPQPALAGAVDAASLLHRRVEALCVGVREPERAPPLVDHDRRPQAVTTIGTQRRGDCFRERQAAGVERHPDLRVGAEAIERGDLAGQRDPAGDRDPRTARRAHQLLDLLDRGAAETTLPLHEGDEEAVDEARKLFHPLDDPAPGSLTPAVDHHLAVARIERRDHAVAGKFAQQLRGRHRPQDNLARPPVEPATRGLHVADPAADAARRDPAEALDQRGVLPAPERGVEVHHRDLAGESKALRDRDRISRVEHLLLAPHELHRPSVHHVDRGNDHLRTSRPSWARTRFTSATVKSPS